MGQERGVGKFGAGLEGREAIKHPLGQKSLPTASLFLQRQNAGKKAGGMSPEQN